MGATTTKRRPPAAHQRLWVGGWVLVLLAALALRPWVPAAAQAEVAVQALTIELWPEYDQPAVLVILRVTLDPAVPLPATVTLHLPAHIAGPSAVAAQDPSGQLLNTPYTTTAGSAGAAVEVQTVYASFQVEYYDPAIQVTGEDRTYTFAWQPDFPVSAATLRVQEPAGARNLTTTPPVTLAGTSGLGLNYYTAALGALTTGQVVTVELRYAKATAALSEAATTPNPVLPASDGLAVTVEPVRTSMAGQVLPIAAVGTGLVLLAALGFGLGRGLRAQASRRNMPPRPPVVMSAAAFCTQCGRRAAAEDRFCRKCGAPLRG